MCSLLECWILHTHIVNYVVLLWYDCMVLTLWILDYEHILYIFIAFLMLMFVLWLNIFHPFYEKNHVMSNYINNKSKCMYNDWIYPFFAFKKLETTMMEDWMTSVLPKTKLVLWYYWMKIRKNNHVLFDIFTWVPCGLKLHPLFEYSLICLLLS